MTLELPRMWVTRRSARRAEKADAALVGCGGFLSFMVGLAALLTAVTELSMGAFVVFVTVVAACLATIWMRWRLQVLQRLRVTPHAVSVTHETLWRSHTTTLPTSGLQVEEESGAWRALRLRNEQHSIVLRLPAVSEIGPLGKVVRSDDPDETEAIRQERTEMDWLLQHLRSVAQVSDAEDEQGMRSALQPVRAPE